MSKPAIRAVMRRNDEHNRRVHEMGMNRIVRRNRELEQRLKAKKNVERVSEARFKIARASIAMELRDVRDAYQKYPNRETFREYRRVLRLNEMLELVREELHKKGEMMIKPKHRIWEFLLDEPGKTMRLLRA